MKINSDTRLIGLIGNPVGHSISPSIHNSIYSYFGMNYLYAAFGVAPTSIDKAVEGMVALSFVGFNVTIPYKQRILGLLDDVDQEASIIGAVNTVKINNGKLKGYNTDGMGFIDGLQRIGVRPNNSVIALLGAGGAARGIAAYLLKEGASRIYILNRTYQKGVDLANELNHEYSTNAIVPVDRAELNQLELDLIVNTTSAGMHPHVEINPLEGFIFDPNTVVVDIIYNPTETRLLRAAKEQGCVTQNGIDMLIGQALASIKIWTGKEISYTSCRKALKSNDLSICL